MKYLYPLLLTLCIFENTIFTKETDHKKKTAHKISQQPKSKTITISIHPKPTIDMQVNLSSSKAIKLETVIITPNTESIEIEVPTKNNPDLPVLKNSDDANSVEFFIFPRKLGQYVNKSKETRKHYNYNSELDRSGEPANGEYRLFTGLTTSVKYSYDKLPKHIVLPNPMEILHDLLDCNC